MQLDYRLHLTLLINYIRNHHYLSRLIWPPCRFSTESPWRLCISLPVPKFPLQSPHRWKGTEWKCTLKGQIDEEYTFILKIWELCDEIQLVCGDTCYVLTDRGVACQSLGQWETAWLLFAWILLVQGPPERHWTSRLQSCCFFSEGKRNYNIVLIIVIKCLKPFVSYLILS